MSSLTSAFGWGVTLLAIGAGLIIVYLVVKSRYKKAGPDEALIVYGRRKLMGKKIVGEEGDTKGYRIVRGGGIASGVQYPFELGFVERPVLQQITQAPRILHVGVEVPREL